MVANAAYADEALDLHVDLHYSYDECMYGFPLQLYDKRHWAEKCWLDDRYFY